MAATPVNTVTEQQIIQQSLDACVSSGLDAQTCLSLTNQTLAFIDPNSPCAARIRDLAGKNQLKAVVIRAVQTGQPICTVLGQQGQKSPAQVQSDSIWRGVLITGLGLGLGALLSTIFTNWWKGRS